MIHTAHLVLLGLSNQAAYSN